MDVWSMSLSPGDRALLHTSPNLRMQVRAGKTHKKSKEIPSPSANKASLSGNFFPSALTCQSETSHGGGLRGGLISQ